MSHTNGLYGVSTDFQLSTRTFNFCETVVYQ